MSVNSSSRTFSFLKAACHANPDAEKNKEGLIQIFQCIYFQGRQIHQPAKMYHFECMNYNIQLSFLFYVLSNFFLRPCNVDQQYL